ncbi:hypothetical protein N0V95_009575 [Ascochyta clinopodiicola]|nr:hypothetical protein N0V95_009575 [Ascochyta clinopodiicola]
MTTPQPTTPQSASEQRVCPFPGEVYTLSVDDRPVFPTSDQTELDEADKADFASELDADLQNVYNNVMDDFFYDRRLRASTWAPIAILPNPKLYSTVFDLCSGSHTEPITHEEHISLLRTARRIHDAVSRALGYIAQADKDERE